MALDLGLLLWIICFAFFALGSDHFINPPDFSSQKTTSPSSYPVYAVGDILDVSWVTAAGVVDLVINQLNSPPTEIDRTPNSVALTTGAYTWKITTDGSDGGAKFDLAFSNIFNFMAFKVNSTTITSQSAYFNISNATINQHGQRIATTLTSTSTILLPTFSISSSLSSTQSAFWSSSTLPASSLSSSSTSATSTTEPVLPKTSTGIEVKLGLGIGVGIASFAAVTGVIIWFLFQRRKRNIQQTPWPLDYDPQRKDISLKAMDAHENWAPPSELPVLAAQRVYPSKSPLTSQKGFPTELPS